MYICIYKRTQATDQVKGKDTKKLKRPTNK